MLTVYLDAGELRMNLGINAFMMTVNLRADICTLKGDSSNLVLHFHKVAEVEISWFLIQFVFRQKIVLR